MHPGQTCSLDAPAPIPIVRRNCPWGTMISVVIPTLNAEATLAATLAALVPAAVEGLVREVIVVDGGSTDQTAEIVDDAGAQLICKSGGRGYQLAVGALRAQAAVAAVPARRHGAGRRLGARSQPVHGARRHWQAVALRGRVPLCAGRHRRQAAAARAAGGAALRPAAPALRRPGPADPAPLYDEVGEYPAAAADGGCRSRTPPRTSAHGLAVAPAPSPAPSAIGGTATCAAPPAT